MHPANDEAGEIQGGKLNPNRIATNSHHTLAKINNAGILLTNWKGGKRGRRLRRSRKRGREKSEGSVACTVHIILESESNNTVSPGIRVSFVPSKSNWYIRGVCIHTAASPYEIATSCLFISLPLFLFPSPRNKIMVIDYPTWKPPSGISITYVCIPTGNLPLIRSNSKVTQFTPASNLKWDCLMAQGTLKWAFPTSQERVVSIGTGRTTGLFSAFPPRVSIIWLLLPSLILSLYLSRSLDVLVRAPTHLWYVSRKSFREFLFTLTIFTRKIIYRRTCN